MISRSFLDPLLRKDRRFSVYTFSEKLQLLLETRWCRALSNSYSFNSRRTFGNTVWFSSPTNRKRRFRVCHSSQPPNGKNIQKKPQRAQLNIFSWQVLKQILKAYWIFLKKWREGSVDWLQLGRYYGLYMKVPVYSGLCSGFVTAICSWVLAFSNQRIPTNRIKRNIPTWSV